MKHTINDPNTYSTNMLIDGYVNIINGMNMSYPLGEYGRNKKLSDANLDLLKDNFGFKTIKDVNDYIVKYGNNLNEVILDTIIRKSKLVYRMIITDEDFKLQEGQNFVFRAIASTSKHIDVILSVTQFSSEYSENSIKYIFQICIPAGFSTARTTYYHHNSTLLKIDEYEYLLPLCTVVKISKIYKVKEYVFVTCKVVHQPDISIEDAKTWKVPNTSDINVQNPSDELQNIMNVIKTYKPRRVKLNTTEISHALYIFLMYKDTKLSNKVKKELDKVKKRNWTKSTVYAENIDYDITEVLPTCDFWTCNELIYPIHAFISNVDNVVCIYKIETTLQILTHDCHPCPFIISGEYEVLREEDLKNNCNKKMKLITVSM